MADELSAPLGRKRRRKTERSGLPWGRIGLGVLLAFAAGISAWTFLVDDPLGGRPVAQVEINTQTPQNSVIEDLSTGEPTEQIISQQSGPGGPSIITLGETLALPSDTGAIDAGQPYEELVEMTASGPLPRVSSSGLKPYEAYARPSITPQTAGGRKLIGVVVTGLGLNDGTTRQAIETLPGTITLAFAPYGQNVGDLASLARVDGHEIMLEIPLEPFDYPQNDPGPHTLLVEQPPRQNLEKLHWVMSRMSGYTGVINHMGARFTASAADFAPMMEELGLRGLSYLDDGSSNRSVAPQLAGQNAVPYARALRELDGNPSQAAIVQQLDALKASADANGQAIGLMSALPVSIRTLAEWADALDEENYLLVPISTLADIER